MRKLPVSSVSVCKVTEGNVTYAEDLLATEEPLAIRVTYSIEEERLQRDLAVTMRTPGNDKELALGFLFSEGIIRKLDEVQSIRHCSELSRYGGEGNVIKVELAPGVSVDPIHFQRHSFVSSSCGICGKASLDAIRMQRRAPSTAGAFEVHAEILLGLSAALSGQQRVFGYTGGIHAAALFDAGGELRGLLEDVGRHNAVDKLIGVALSQDWLPLEECILFLSGRASFELLQKAAMAGLRVVCSVGAPSSLAVECALDFDITLVGFLRDGRFNIYSNEKRIRVL